MRLDSDALATRDIDLLWDTRKRITFSTQLDRVDSSMLGVLKKVDPTFRIRHGQKYTAVNKDGFEVDIIRRERAGDDPHPIKLSDQDEDFWVVQARRATELSVVAAVLQAGTATWIHCGDSRLYMVRAGELLTRTRDHSYLELRNMPPGLERINRNVLFTCLGSPTKPIYDMTGPVHLEQGDRILLCSDGLWGTLSDDEIAKQLSRNTVSHAVPDLVEDALRKAGDSSDNVTVVALEWETPDAFESTQGVSTDSISEDVFASTIQAGPLDGLVDDLDDAAIERSIAEINEAIRRSAARKA